VKDYHDRRVLDYSDARLVNGFYVRRKRPGFDEDLGLLERSWTITARHWRRARYTPRSMTAPPTSFSIPRTSLKNTMPEATPVTVIRYW
jgi:hypothetical protein